MSEKCHAETTQQIQAGAMTMAGAMTTAGRRKPSAQHLRIWTPAITSDPHRFLRSEDGQDLASQRDSRRTKQIRHVETDKRGSKRLWRDPEKPWKA